MLPSIFDTCVPRDEIVSGDLSLDLFAAKLRLVVEGRAPQVYQDPSAFFANTYPTSGLKLLLSEVFGRLAQVTVGSPVIRLETSFGGGKTHDLIALWHIAKQGRAISGLERFVPDLSQIPAQTIQVAAVDGRDLDPVNGIFHPETGITTYTLWGEIAYQIGGISGYQLLKGSDEQRVSPGTSVLERLTQGQPTLIALDEIARYMRAAKATAVSNSDLSAQVVAFLFSLMDLAASSTTLVFVYSLASAADTFAEETSDLDKELKAMVQKDVNELIQTSARQERVLTPSSDVEIYNIVKQRLFQSVSVVAAQNAARDYLSSIRASRLSLPEGSKESHYAQQIESSYPFHPELFSLLTKKVASIPEFQRTRGALRLFALVVRHLWQQRPDWIPMIHPHHVPIGVDPDITSELTSKIKRPLMLLPVQADISNPDGKEAHAQIQDGEWLVAGKPPFSSWVGRTIFLHSLTQGISSGIRRPELNLSILTPQLEMGLIDKALERLVSVAWYLDNDPITTIARFKEEPSINKIIAEEKDQIGITQAKDDLRARRDTIFASRLFNLVSAPEGSQDVDDDPNSIALCVIDFDESKISSSQEAAPPLLEQIFNNTGESGKFRTFRNRLLFLCANRQELDRAIDNAREYRAIRTILASPNRLDDLSENQQKSLKQREGEMDLAVRIALTNAYRHLFYPAQDPVKAPKGLMHYVLPAQDASDVKGKNNQQDVILKALKDCQKIRPEDAAPFAPAYLLQKVWPAGLDHWTTRALREAFAKDLGLNILLDAEISKLRETIRTGIQSEQWDLKAGERVFIKAADGQVSLPESIEFSERMELYRRGILQPPTPREVELSAQLMPASAADKPVRIRWRAAGALRVNLYQNGIPLTPREFLPSDEVEVQIQSSTVFRVVAEYGNGEQAEAQAPVNLTTYSTGSIPSPRAANGATPTLFAAQPTILETEGSPNAALERLKDDCSDHKVQGIPSFSISVDQVTDYRKLSTAFPLLNKFTLLIDQAVTLQTPAQQFVRLEYQGDYKGFQSFLTPTNALLGSSGVQATVRLKLTFHFADPIAPTGPELATIQQALVRNPVDRLRLQAQVSY